MEDFERLNFKAKSRGNKTESKTRYFLNELFFSQIFIRIFFFFTLQLADKE